MLSTSSMGATVLVGSALRRPRSAVCAKVRCSTQQDEAASTGDSDGQRPTIRRRQLFQVATAAVLSSALAQLPVSFPDSPPENAAFGGSRGYTLLLDAPAFAATAVEVGTYLPSAGVDDLVVFKPGPRDTPALRAGNVSPYSFFLPPKWTQQRIANILSGNYCQPKCAEPWIEVKFEDPKQGSLQVVASPMVRLTNKPAASIEEIGPPEQIIAALGPFVTGDSYDPDELVSSSVTTVDGQTYYNYALETPYARSGPHNLACATAKGNTVLLFVISATDAQWAASEPLLQQLLGTFRV